METLVRLLGYADADGATNMSDDEALVRSAAGGVASLRFYGWTAATVSLGYFQPHAIRLADSRLSALPWVRRPSGGATLVHHHEITYALALPGGVPWQSKEPYLIRVHRVIVNALAELGLAGKVELVGANPIRHGDVLCFQQFTTGDVLCSGKKIVGSAQRKYRHAILQHGSILLAMSEHAPQLPGIKEIAGVTLAAKQLEDSIVHTLAKETSWRIEQGTWSDREKSEIEQLIVERYANAEWNERR